MLVSSIHQLHEKKSEKIRSKLDAARAVPESVDIFDLLPTAIRDCYHISLDHLNEQMVAAWKVGGANPWSREAFSIDGPFIGALLADEVSIGTPDISLADLYKPLAEPEVMLELSQVPGIGVEASFSRMAIGIEFPASVLDNRSKQTLAGQIVDRAGAGRIWISTPQEYDKDILDNLWIRYGKLNSTLTSGGAYNVIGGPVGAANASVSLAIDMGAPLRSGQWIATGGLVPAIPVLSGEELVLESSLGCVSVRLT